MFFGGLKFAGSLLNIFGNKKCSRGFPTKFFVKVCVINLMQTLLFYK